MAFWPSWLPEERARHGSKIADRSCNPMQAHAPTAFAHPHTPPASHLLRLELTGCSRFTRTAYMRPCLAPTRIPARQPSSVASFPRISFEHTCPASLPSAASASA
ncbi:hypothetical protein KFK09_008849 [Dendrobium nobile]|uniref:Uncharacterized protein n=1 Tax=Dendrobium nobile TaxID=94219 RepID=A0A8T3BMC1_DENNO|nr:hypothetical protein KFK09_008849 [Dendrobium nobile]